MKEVFIRQEMALGREAMERLDQAHVAVFGIGGVGSFVCEALARSGVGALTLVDCDTISQSNINRQLIALHSTLGKYKADVMKDRILDINPDCQVRAINDLYNEENKEKFFDTRYTYIADCIDLVSCKLSLIQNALERNIPIISALGTGNKLDASAFQVSDISKTSGCPLARILRKELRSRGIVHHKVVFSPEEPLEPLQFEAPPPGRRSVPASVSFVPSSAGLLLAGAIIRDIAGV